MVRLDMSEYMERHTVAKLIGSPPGYVGYSDGGQLTDAVRRQPYTVVLFDEIEKAHPDVYNLMLQMFDEGRLTDSKGALIDFQNTILIMTSNLGSNIIQQSLPVNPTLLGKGATKEELATDVEVRVKKLLLKKLSEGFRPEFLNRIDEILVFNSLTKDEALEVADLFLNNLSQQLLKQGYLLFVDGMAKKYIVEVGYDKIYGARPIRRTIKRLIEAPLSKVILAHNLKPGLYYRLYVETEFDNIGLKVKGITVTWAEPYQDNEIDNNNLPD
jgi:ATP-dependent Clp protease ATP-binding subunit ClpC